jgi:RNA polymerase sigma-70 factor (ECF subfamily)
MDISSHNPTGELTDTELVRGAKRGDLDAFERLVKRHERRIYGLARRLTGSDHDAQDVTQQAFMSAVKNLAGFRGGAAFSTWLTTIAAHAAFKVARKRRGLPTTSLDAATEVDEDGQVPHPEYIADWREGPDRLVQRTETHRLLDDAIAELDPAHRAVFLLRDVEEFSVRDTAKALKLSEANVKVRLLRARMQLRERLTRVFGDKTRRYKPDRHLHTLATGKTSEEAAHARQTK